jgi:predicted HTH transcriptional regulator
MKSEEIKKLVAKSENAAVEFKRARGGVPADFWPSYSAFANTDGGTIILGIREKDGKREVEGLPDVEKTVADIWNAVNNAEKISANVLFNESVYPIEVDGKQLVLDELTIADLDADSIRRYRMYFSQLRPGHVWSGLADDGFLMKIGAAARGRDGKVHPTLAGLVCFGDFNEITNVLPYFFLDYREHLSPDVRWTDRVCSGDANWSGNIFDFFFRINQSITAGVKVPFKIASDNVTRDDDTPVHKALREVLANALIHADYHGRRGIVIDKYPKRLEVSNPGTLRMSKSVAIAGGTSDARNGKIFNIFSLVRIGERSGMGLSSLYGVWEKEKFAEPSIIESYEPDRTKVIVEFESDESELGVKTPEVGVETREVGVENAEVGVKTQEVGVETSELGVTPGFDVLMGAYRNDFRANARKVLSALAEHPEMDFVRLSQVLNLSQNSVWRAVRALREVGLLVREGADKGGKWIVKK